MEDALFHNASGVITDAVAEFARICRIRRHLSSIAIVLSVNVTAFFRAQVHNSGRCHYGCSGRRKRRAARGRAHVRVHVHDHGRHWYFRTGDDGTALVGSLFDDAILSNGFSEWTNLEKAHEHGVAAGAV